VLHLVSLTAERSRNHPLELDWSWTEIHVLIYVYIRALHAHAGWPLQSLLAVSDRSSPAYSTENRPVLGLGWSFGEPQAERDRFVWL